ncbi:MAG: hypothetical protein COB37_01815 [Kordiimonadales bacterium]|nr:MAG: hypothetical protein COB37_01815 [Kordiimonadales bacterium]
MNAALDHIAGFSSSAPLSRTTLRRGKNPGFVGNLFAPLGRGIREWGYGTRLYTHRLKGRHPVQLLGSLKDPAHGNATLGSAIIGGDMLHGTEQLKLGIHFWSRLASARPSLINHAHSYNWLQDLAQTSKGSVARDTAEALITSWITVGAEWDKTIWQADILSKRLINWLSHAPLILSSMDLVYRSKVLHSMARQTRHLMRTCGDATPGIAVLEAAAALMLSGLLLPGGNAWETKGARLMRQAVAEFILPDGGPATRNTADALRAMQLLILLRDAYIETDSDLPPWVQISLDRLAPFVRTMRHIDGSFAHIGGVSAECNFSADAILAASKAKGKAIENASHVGIQRLQVRTSCVIMDCGPAPQPRLSRSAHASTGSFEFSAGQERLVVNMGPAARSGALAQLAGLSRATAAHSALVISDTNSSRILENGLIGAGVAETLTIREKLENGTRVKLMHDGYLARFGVKHERVLTLSMDGKKLTGTDKLYGPKIKKLAGQSVQLRFHLHPLIEARLAPDGRISLATRSGKIWIFSVEGGTAGLEESLYLAQPDRPVGTQQIVVTLKLTNQNTPICDWAFSETNP